jgi:transposase
MTLHARKWSTVPEDTARAARTAFPKGNVYMTMRDELGLRYEDTEFAALFTASQGRPAESPGRLALVTIMQFAENLTDRQAAEAVAARIDWKYALELALGDPGFDHSILADFRERVIAGGAEQQLLDDMLAIFKDRKLLKARGRQRTDSTHVLAAIRKLNRLQCLGETLRAALNTLATAAPDWLRSQISSDWFDLYGPRFEQYRLPKEKAEQQLLAEQMGNDGHHLLAAVYAPSAPEWLRHLPAVEVLRQVWIQQYYVDEGQVKLRTPDNLPPYSQLIQSPYDIEARNRTKREVNWTGYTAHVTETCDADTPNVITHIETTPATTADAQMTDRLHQALAEKDLLPGEHFVDTGYMSAEHLIISAENHQIDLIGPVSPDSSWQARAQAGFDITSFGIDWEAQRVTCPAGQTSHSWRSRAPDRGHALIEVHFDPADCRGCASRLACTQSRDGPRMLKLKHRAEHEALQTARQRQTTPQFKERYRARAGIEGTLSQGTRAFDLRRSRYIGLAKTRLQHVATAAAINLTRVVAWLHGIPKARTRVSHFAALAVSG